jgi:hypothetical protein
MEVIGLDKQEHVPSRKARSYTLELRKKQAACYRSGKQLHPLMQQLQ